MPTAWVDPTKCCTEGSLYADGQLTCAEADLCRGDTPTATLGIAYADGKAGYADGWQPSAHRWIPVVV